MEKIKVYYNSACPVCKAGIEDQQCRMQAQAVTDVEWLDVHVNPQHAQEVGVDLEAIRERLHVKSADGSVHVGTDAFAMLFNKTKEQRWLGKALQLPVVRPLAMLAYKVFARLLYRWNRAKRHW